MRPFVIAQKRYSYNPYIETEDLTVHFAADYMNVKSRYVNPKNPITPGCQHLE